MIARAIVGMAFINGMKILTKNGWMIFLSTVQQNIMQMFGYKIPI